MKTKIRTVISDGSLGQADFYWKYSTICDMCGQPCSKIDTIYIQKPNTKEKDYCVICIRKLLDENLFKRGLV